jgi:glycosyltransferase involved in cell wall biosynthesis
VKKVLFVVPHLSTGGLPQYTLKLIESLIYDYEIYCLEYKDITGGVLTVQRNKISSLLGHKFYSLTHDNMSIHDVVDILSPDVIHFQEIPETFISNNDLEKIYDTDRQYKIVVTTHGSNTNPEDITYGADKFVLVSNWSRDKFVDTFGEELCDIWEYPIEKMEYSKEYAKKELGFDKNYKHILNVGLFTPGKNQKELIEIAKRMKNERVKFHFVGNQAQNFQDYWQPLMDDFPDNCIWHGERDDVDKFYKASDLFYFTSNFELNPLSIKEALSYGLPTFIKKLEPYGSEYDGLVNYIRGDIETQINCIKESLNLEKKSSVLTIILAHADTLYRKKLLYECLDDIHGEKLLSSNFIVDTDIQEICDHVIYTKNNPLLFNHEFDKYDVSYNYWWIDDKGVKHTKPLDYEHGYAAYTLIQNGLRYAKMLGKDRVHVVNYDYKIDKSTFELHENLLKDYDMVMYEQKDVAYKNESAFNSAFFSGKLESLNSFFEKYTTLKEYYTDGNGFNILERKLFNHYKSQSYDIFSSSVDDLKNDNILNREAILQFSKSEKYENLSFGELCKVFNCDKAITHEYHIVYEKFISKFRDKEINLFEIGIDAGSSLKVWQNYLPFAMIYGMDISKTYDIKRGKIFLGDQSNMNDMVSIVNKIPKCKIIVDDGSHVADHQLKSFYYLFENLLDWGGVYVIEDIECNYWRPETKIYGYETGYTNIVDYFTKLNHSVNHGYSNHTNDMNIQSISYYPNCIVITKSDKPKTNSLPYRFQNKL